MPAMDPGLAVRALGQVLAGGDQVLAVADVDWAQFAAGGAGRLPFLRDLPELSAAGRDPGPGAGLVLV